MFNILDHVSFKYEILEILGRGSFGTVVKVFDHKRKQFLALKIIRNKKKFHDQALIELNILTYIKEKDPDNNTNIVKIKDFVIFRKHVCLVFELLSINLYDLMKNNDFVGLSLELIRRFAIQILNALNFLRKNRIIHSDLKPENILLKSQNKSGIKIADFGSSCFASEKLYTYIQSRYYRSPEIILGQSYEESIDMWSFGCIMAELHLGNDSLTSEEGRTNIPAVRTGSTLIHLIRLSLNDIALSYSSTNIASDSLSNRIPDFPRRGRARTAGLHDGGPGSPRRRMPQGNKQSAREERGKE